MTTQTIDKDPAFFALLQRHFILMKIEVDYQDVVNNCVKKHAVYAGLLKDAQPLFSVRKGVFISVSSVVLFIAYSGDLFPVSSSVQGVPAAMFRSHAFLNRSDILSNPDDFLTDAGKTFPKVRDWAAHTLDAKKAVKSQYNILHLDDF